MRILVLRSDIPLPIRIHDLETVSQANASTEALGPPCYLNLPNQKRIASLLAPLPPVLVGDITDINFPLVINSSKRTLRIRSATTDAYTVVTIATATYTNLPTLLAAINTALSGTAFEAVAKPFFPKQILFRGRQGAAIRVQIDSTAGGSTLNASMRVSTSGAVSTVAPDAATFVTSVMANGYLTPAAMALASNWTVSETQGTSLLDAMATDYPVTPRFLKSLAVGSIAKLLRDSYLPHPSSLLPPGKAVTLGSPVDGSMGYEFAVTTLVIVSADFFTYNPDLRLRFYGPWLNVEGQKPTFVFRTVAGAKINLTYQAIIKAGGTTLGGSFVGSPDLGNAGIEIRIPASILAGVSAGDTVTLVWSGMTSDPAILTA